MKKTVCLVLCLAMLVPMLCVGTFAAEPLDIRELKDKGQQHIYVGESMIEEKPVADGQILEGEYSVSQEITLINCPESDFSDAKLHFAHDRKNIYIAFEVADPKFNALTSKYTFNFGFPISGGFSDAASCISLPITLSDGKTTSAANAEYRDHSGGVERSQSVSAIKFVSTHKGTHDNATHKTIIEMHISISLLRRNFGFVVSDEMMLSLDLKSESKTYGWNVALDSETQSAIEAAYPDRATPKLTKAPHMIYFSDSHENQARYGFYTVDGASVKLLDNDNIALRFETVYKKAYIDKLKEDNPGADVYVGTMIIEADSLKPIKNIFTKDAILGYRAPIKLTEVYADINNPLRSDGETNTYAGSIRTILNSATEYAAIGFVNVGGSYIYSPTYTVRSAESVATTALRDLACVKSDAYSTEILLYTTENDGEGKLNSVTEAAFSCYTDNDLFEYCLIGGDCASGLLGHFWDLHPKVEGTLRIVAANIYFHKLYKYHANDTEEQKRVVIKRTADLVEETQGDVILLQEASNGMLNGTRDYRLQDRLNPMLEAIGYKMVDAKVGAFPAGTSSANFAGCNYTPIWYNPEVVTLEASEHNFYSSVGTNPDGGLSSSKGFTWALFTEKATGKKFIAASTHLTWHGDSNTGNILRTRDANELVTRLKEVSAQYNAPIVVGGDFNSAPNKDPYNVVVKTYQNSKDTARVLFNSKYTGRHDYLTTTIPSIGNAIDHMFVTKYAFDIKLYQTVINHNALISSDHLPVSIDITIK